MLNAKETWLFGRLYKVTKYVIYFTYKSAKVQKCSYHQNIQIVRRAVFNAAVLFSNEEIRLSVCSTIYCFDEQKNVGN